MNRPATRKLFTPAEANRTLPLVRRIVRDILDRGQRLRELLEGDELLKTPETEDTIAQLRQELAEYSRELDSIGCSYKDWNFEIGLIDFPARIDDRDVLLCWRSDEDSLTWYHGLTDGFAGRKKIPPELLEE